MNMFLFQHTGNYRCDTVLEKSVRKTINVSENDDVTSQAQQLT